MTPRKWTAYALAAVLTALSFLACSQASAGSAQPTVTLTEDVLSGYTIVRSDLADDGLTRCAMGVREAAEAYGYPTIRMFMLMSHYRSPLNYSGEILLQAKAARERVETAMENLRFLTKNAPEGELNGEQKAFVDSLPRYRERFIEAMEDDFNTADAIAVIFELVREANAATAAEKQPVRAVAQAALDLLEELNGVVGIVYGNEDDDAGLTAKVEALIEARAQAKKEKNYAEADRIRDELKDMGIAIMDTKQGVQWKKI